MKRISPIFMKTPLPYIFLSLALVGCGRPALNQLEDWSGSFSLTNSTGTVVYETIQNLSTNGIQFILLVPYANQMASGSQGRNGINYNYWDMKINHGGHQWKIESKGTVKTGTKSLRFSDLTANTVTNLDLEQTRFWQISEEGKLIPLRQIDPAIRKEVLSQSGDGYRKNETFKREAIKRARITPWF